MIAFATSVTKPEVYSRCAEPGIRLAAEPDSVIAPTPSAGSAMRSYNEILDRFADLAGLEALVLVHQDAELVDPGFCGKLRAALADPEVGVVGCVGAIGVQNIAWWEGSVTWASFSHRYSELGGGELPAFSWKPEDMPPFARTGEVETVDGFVLGLSPWVLRNVRFDESLGSLHGYDFDFCLQVREAGRKVVTTDFGAIHHHTLDVIQDREGWIDAHVRIAEKWSGRMPNVGGAGRDWRYRARRAEAEADAAALTRHMIADQTVARVRELEHGLRETRTSISWRITAPFRLASSARSSPAAQRLARRLRQGARG